MIHSGGDSQRLPLQSVCGKAWSALPTLSNTLNLQAPIDLLIRTLTKLFASVSSGLVVASSDVLLLIPDTFHVDWPQDGATGLAIPSPKEIGPNHGVYQVEAIPDPSAASLHAPVSRFFQKASVTELTSAGAVSGGGEVLLDTGVIYFAPPIVSSLLTLARTAPLLSCTYLGLDTATMPLRVELYSDMMMAMSEGLGQSFASYRDMGTSDLNPERLVAARGLMWRALSPVPFYAAIAVGGRFLHVGTTTEYRALLTEPSQARDYYSLRQSAACYDRTTSSSVESVSHAGAVNAAASADGPVPAASCTTSGNDKSPCPGTRWFASLNTVFESEGERGAGAVAEHCVLRGNWSLSPGSIASGVRTVRHLLLFEGIAAQESLVPEESAGLDVDGGTMATAASFESPATAALSAAASAVGITLATAGSAPAPDRAASLSGSGADLTVPAAHLVAVQSAPGPPLVSSALRVISVLHASDPIKTQWREPTARVCGATWDAFWAAAGVTDADVWPADVTDGAQTLWTAKLFPVTRRTVAADADAASAVAGDGSGPDDSAMPVEDAAALWLQEAAVVASGSWGDCKVATPAAVALWRSSERLSLKDILQRADARAEFAWRRRLRGEVDARLVVEAVRRQSNVPLGVLLSRLGGGSASVDESRAPTGPAGGSAGLELVMRTLHGLDKLAKGPRLDVAARALSVQSALLWSVAGWGGHDQRSGPAANRDWALPMALLEGTQPGLGSRSISVGGAEGDDGCDGRSADTTARRQGIRLLASVRDRWLLQRHLAGRAARHLERASQLLTAQCVYTAEVDAPRSAEGAGGATRDEEAATAARAAAAEHDDDGAAAPGSGASGPLSRVVDGAAPLVQGRWAVATAPVRVDLAGGWSDTPPVHYEAGPARSGVSASRVAGSDHDADTEAIIAAYDAEEVGEYAAPGSSAIGVLREESARGGGLVINAAIKIDGRKPVGTRARRCARSVIVIRTRSSVRPDEATAAFRGAPEAGLREDAEAAAAGVPGFILSEVVCESLADIADYYKPTAQGSLVKSALLCLGLVTLPRRALHEDTAAAASRASVADGLEHQLVRRLGGGGLEIETWSDLPQGSGLGVSSILAGTVLAAVARCAGVSLPPKSLVHLVLSLEQLLSTGGGYQDQVGGLCGGILASYCRPGLPIDVQFCRLGQCLADAPAGASTDVASTASTDPTTLCTPEQQQRLSTFLGSRLFVLYTGLSRLAKNLLQRVLRQWALRENGVTSTVAMLRANAVLMAEALYLGHEEAVGTALERYWRQKQQMAPRAEPERVTRMREVLSPFVLGSSLCGAGGGGFLVGLMRDGVSPESIKLALRADARTRDLHWTMHDVEVDSEGLQVSVL